MVHFYEVSSSQILSQSRKNSNVKLLKMNKFLPAGQLIIQLMDCVYEYKVAQLVAKPFRCPTSSPTGLIVYFTFKERTIKTNSSQF